MEQRPNPENYQFHENEDEPISLEFLTNLQQRSPEEWKLKLIALLDQGYRIKVQSLIEHSNAVIDVDTAKTDHRVVPAGAIGELVLVDMPSDESDQGYSMEIQWDSGDAMF